MSLYLSVVANDRLRNGEVMVSQLVLFLCCTRLVAIQSPLSREFTQVLIHSLKNLEWRMAGGGVTWRLQSIVPGSDRWMITAMSSRRL